MVHNRLLTWLWELGEKENSVRLSGDNCEENGGQKVGEHWVRNWALRSVEAYPQNYVEFP